MDESVCSMMKAYSKFSYHNQELDQELVHSGNDDDRTVVPTDESFSEEWASYLVDRETLLSDIQRFERFVDNQFKPCILGSRREVHPSADSFFDRLQQAYHLLNALGTGYGAEAVLWLTNKLHDLTRRAVLLAAELRHARSAAQEQNNMTASTSQHNVAAHGTVQGGTGALHDTLEAAPFLAPPPPETPDLLRKFE